MIKEFRTYDKGSQRTVLMKTETFNELLASADAFVRVIPRDVVLREQYEAYLCNCEMNGKTPLSRFDYDREYFYASCSFETHDNVPAEMLISKALGVKSVQVSYSKDWYGEMTDDELEIVYHIA